MSDLKTKENDGDVLGFLNSLDNEQRKEDCKELVKLLKEATGEKPKMWGRNIVGFGRYHYKYDSGREGDWFLTGFSPRKQNLTIYITEGFERYQDLLEGLGKFKTSVSCLYVKKMSDIDKSILKTLVEKSVVSMKKKYG